MAQTKIRRIGNSLGVTLPAQMLQDMGLQEGAQLQVTRVQGTLILRPLSPKTLETLNVASRLLGEHHQILEGLGHE